MYPLLILKPQFGSQAQHLEFLGTSLGKNIRSFPIFRLDGLNGRDPLGHTEL